MRRAPHENDVKHGEVKAVKIVLRDDREPSCRLLIGKIVEWTPVKRDRSLARTLHAVNAFEKRALAAAVRSDDAEKLLIVQMKIHPFENRLLTDEELHGLREYFHISFLQIRKCVSP